MKSLVYMTKLEKINISVVDKMRKILICILFSPIFCHAQLDPLIDYRMGDAVTRNEKGNTQRSKQVIARFKQLYACPSTGKNSGACPGWAIDHVIPLDCGGIDAVYNMQWLPNTIKSGSGSDRKDRFERKIYGGRNMSKGCQ